jgi:hypothetical protein
MFAFLVANVELSVSLFQCDGLQQQAALMAAATAQGTFINPMAALASQMPHGALNGMTNPVVPPTSGESLRVFGLTIKCSVICHVLRASSKRRRFCCFVSLPLGVACFVTWRPQTTQLMHLMAPAIRFELKESFSCWN